MARFGPNGKAHTILRRLAEGSASYDQLADDLGYAGMSATRRRKPWHIIGEMLHAELLGGGRIRYFILPAGSDLLLALDGGREVMVEEVPRPNVRVFAYG